MKFIQLLRILRAHYGLIVLTIASVWVVATPITLLTTPKYVATSSVLINTADTMTSPATNGPPQPYSSFLATQLDLISSQTVALKVVDRLKLADDARAQSRFLGSEPSRQDFLNSIRSSVEATIDGFIGTKSDDADSTLQDPGNERYRLADRLLKKISVRPAPDSNVLQIGYAASAPNAAAEGANAVVQAYIDTILELNVNPARVSSEWLDSQVDRLTENVRLARAKLSDFQQSTGIIAANGADDDETSRLTDLNAQLVAAQSQNHPAIQALKSDLARAQAKMNDLPPQLGPNHPAYRRAQSEVAVLRAHLEEESTRLADGLRREIAIQRESMLHSKRAHAQMAALKDTVDSAQHALDEATQRAAQARMNSQITQTNVSVVRVAVPPRDPTTPNPVFNFSLAVVIGIFLGIGFAIWREVVCRFVRNADDLREYLGIQVLGVLHDGPRSSSGRSRLSNRRTPLLAMNR